MDCSTGMCIPDDNVSETVAPTAATTAVVEDILNPLTFVPPPFNAAMPSITIEFCDRCRWLHRATWVQTELFLTFPPPILRGITLLPLNTPETGGRFRVWLSWAGPNAAEETTPERSKPVVVNGLLWDRKVEGGFPELKVLKQKIRDRLQPGTSLGHSDKKKDTSS